MSAQLLLHHPAIWSLASFAFPPANMILVPRLRIIWLWGVKFGPGWTKMGSEMANKLQPAPISTQPRQHLDTEAHGSTVCNLCNVL